MSATLAVAVATLLAVGGILAGPSILECARDPSGLGACLRDKVADTGLVGPDGESVEQRQSVADVPSEPPLPPAPVGWMEAAANEYEPPAGTPVDLSGAGPGIVAVDVGPQPPSAVEVAIVPPMPLATGKAAMASPSVAVRLEELVPGLRAEGQGAGAPEPVAEVALAGPQGALAATGLPPQAAPGAAAVLAAPEGPLVDAPTLTPEPSLPPVELQAEASVEPAEPPPPPVAFDPQYPNVLVLPPPAEGDNSSFRSLQLN